MNTNIILNSPSRELFGVNVRQETKTGFLNLTDLQEAFTRARVLNGWLDKRIDHIINYQDNCERIFYLLKERNLINVSLHTFTENVKNIGVVKYLKQTQVYKTTGRGTNKTTWCDPYIWVLIALELNPMLYAKVVIWLGDKLLLNRIEAGNFYKSLSRAITKFDNIDYTTLARSLNHKIFGRHETGIRNLATKEELERLYQLEANIAFAIDMGFVKSFNECINLILK